jgi:M6 family metalloprotease-like protein/uncharacterized repeat protein (TIGR01451 family)
MNRSSRITSSGKSPLRSVLVLGAASSLFLAIAFLGAGQAHAVPAAPQEFQLEQPNGDTFQAQLFGDEWSNGVETAGGYTILQDPRNQWEYAEKGHRGRLRPSGAIVGRDRPVGRKHLRDQAQAAAAEELQEKTERAHPGESFSTGEPDRAPSIGTDNSLVILAQFNDQGSLGTTAAQWSSKYFGAENSVKDYYEEVSYGQFSLVPASDAHGANDGVVGWVNVNMNHPNTGDIGDSNKQATRLAIQAADPYVNYAAYDANGDNVVKPDELHITVIAAGQEASCCQGFGSKFVWGHQWSIFGNVTPPVVDGKSVGGWGYTQFGEMHGGHMAALGIMVHEIGHDLDLPDLYDTDRSSSGVGLWSVMGAGSWLRTATDAHDGDTPPHPDAWSKWFKGWIDPQVTAGTQTKLVNASASVLKTNVAVQMLANPNGPDWTWQGAGSGEYFLVENRQPITGTYDESLPGGGLLVLHVDESRGNNANDAARLVDVEEADGLGELNVYGLDRGDPGDLYPGTNNNRTFNAGTNPNSNLISGAASGVSIANVSNSSIAMTADFTAPGGGTSANDGFTNATVISNRSFTSSASNSNAGIEDGEFAQNGCPLGRTLWFKYAPSRDVRIKVDTQNSNFDTVLNVWRGTSLATLQAQACNDDADAANDVRYSRVPEFVANAGQTYYFQAGGYYNSAAGTVTQGSLTFNFSARALNDDYASAQTISSASGTSTENNVNGTKEPNEPNHGGQLGGASIWYRWTAPATGTATFDTLNSPVSDTLLAAYTGNVVNGTLVAQNDDIDAATNRRSRIQFQATQGTVYSIAVDGYGITDRGDMTLNWSLAQAASANLAIDKSVVRNANQLTYTLGVTNAGPQAAQSVTVADTLPAKVAHVSTNSTAGSCAGTTTITCNLGTMANSGQATVTIVATINDTGLINNTATVSSSTTDPTLGNNSDSAEISVEPDPVTDVSVDGYVDDIFQGPAFLYGFEISRSGAGAGTDVEATIELPESVRFDLMYSTGCSGTQSITCNFGPILAGDTQEVEIKVTPRSPGPHTATASIEGGGSDPGNDTYSAVAGRAFICDNEPTEGNDTIIGTSGQDVLCGLGGNDVLKGAEGDDLIFGEAGIDTVVYEGSPDGMIVNLNFQGVDAEGAWPLDDSTTGHGHDHFTGIEQAKGTDHDDELYGRLQNGDKLWGLGGENLIYGYGGKDTLIGGGSSDDLYGGSGSDKLSGAGGNDRLYGNAGLDDLVGGKGSDLCRDKSDRRQGCER